MRNEVTLIRRSGGVTRIAAGMPSIKIRGTQDVLVDNVTVKGGNSAGALDLDEWVDLK